MSLKRVTTAGGCKVTMKGIPEWNDTDRKRRFVGIELHSDTQIS